MKAFDEWYENQDVIFKYAAAKFAYAAGQQARQIEFEHLTEMNQRYIGKMQEQQDQIADLRARIVEVNRVLDGYADNAVRCVHDFAELTKNAMKHRDQCIEKECFHTFICTDDGSEPPTCISCGYVGT